MQLRSVLLSVIVCSSLFTPGCYLGDEGASEEVGEVASPQLDPDGRAWRLFKLSVGGVPFARALAIGGANMGNYTANTEYWYVDPAALSALGAKNIVFTHSGGDSYPPSQRGPQSFALPREVPWEAFQTDPVSGGALYRKDNVYLRITKNQSGLTRLTWYQILADGVPTNIVPSGTFVPVRGSVSVPSGHVGYYIDQAVK
ncbi:hypothetical protein BE21_02195 [Sorangium cellulosum]|uniref:Uncharacterized protein n=1 Tax=Sorangium cellulosum TaxID=56 RepID=A0A150TTB8_SORCE|nr:hypothetical protein BE21_02195 [Sorangium cellulosum]